MYVVVYNSFIWKHSSSHKDTLIMIDCESLDL